MRKGLVITLAAIVVAAIPAVVFAEKFNTRITAHADDEPERIFGVVRSPEVACEKRREVRLFGPEQNGFGKGAQQNFRRYALTQTNRFGEYEFVGSDHSILGKGNGLNLPPGDYYTKALRKDFPGNVCRYDDSRIVTLEDDQTLPP